MPRWNDPRGSRYQEERGRREMDRKRGGRPEPRAFERERLRREPGRYPDDEYDEAWRWRREGATHDLDRVGYGRPYEDAGEAAAAHWHEPEQESDRYDDPDRLSGGEAEAYHGQEYGVEGRGLEPGADPGWRLEPNDQERRRNFDFDDPGSGQSQAGYATRSTHEHQFDPDYVRWREEQLRNHDRAYEAWRRRQHLNYDAQYRKARERGFDRR